MLRHLGQAVLGLRRSGPRCTGVLAASSMLWSGCVGALDAPAVPAEWGSGSPVGALCESGKPRPTPLRRLSKEQYGNSLRSIIGGLDEADRVAIWSEVEPALEQLPDDVVDKHRPFSTQDQTLSAAHVRHYLRIAETLAGAITSDAKRMQRFMACRPAESPSACIADFIERLAAKAYRRTPSAEDIALLLSAYADGPRIRAEGVRDVLVAALNAPAFLYQLELGTSPVGGQPEVVALSG